MQLFVSRIYLTAIIHFVTLSAQNKNQGLTGDVYKAGKVNKVVPLHAMEVLGGEKKYSSFSFTTLALEGVSGQRHAQTEVYLR
jgi:hypothetical protein